jgi:hypothetical protein
MAEAKRLTMGVDRPSLTPDEEKGRVEVLCATVQKYLPDFARGVAESAASAKEDKDSTIVLHQDDLVEMAGCQRGAGRLCSANGRSRHLGKTGATRPGWWQIRK